MVNGSNKQLQTTGPDVAFVAVQSADLKNASGTQLIKRFETPTNVPGLAGTIPAGSEVRFILYMKKNSNWGGLYPTAKLSTSAVGAPQVCSRTYTSRALDQTLFKYDFTCTAFQSVTVATSDRFILDISVELTPGPGNHSTKAEVDIEGTAGGNYDSLVKIPNPLPTPVVTSVTPSSARVNYSVVIGGSDFGASSGTVKFGTTSATPTAWSDTSITVPVPNIAVGSTSIVVTTAANMASAGFPFVVLGPPTITSLTPSKAHLTDAITVAGSGFAATQGTSTVKFNAVTAAPTAWSDTSITVPVPTGATSATSDVTVTILGQTSNGKVFTLIPPPTLSVAAPSSARRSDSVTIFGTDFGSAQGSNTVKFNGVVASVSNWSDTSITASVPTTATSGDLVVSISGQPSNALAFTVLIPGTMSGTVTRATGGSAVSGASVQAVLTGVVKGTATTAGNGSYTIADLDPGSYDVRVFATGLSPELRSGQSVTSQANTTVDVQMYAPGNVSGRVTQTDGTTPIAGAAVAVYSGATQKGTTNTNGTGDYSIANLHPGAYTVQAANPGYTTTEQGASVTESTTTTKNFSLAGAPANPVLYAYDALGRLVQVTDPAGESAIYRYDPVGNITSIERPGTASVAISSFTPLAGLVGDLVTIFGTGFSATPTQNVVTFNGAAATVTQATPTQLAVTVPSVAVSQTPYEIAVAVGANSANRSGFTVKADVGVPTIIGFSPTLAAVGAALTISGTNFDPVAGNDRLTLNASFAPVTSPTTTSMQTTIPSSAFTGHVAVATPNGTATSTNYLWIPPPPYTVADVEDTLTLSFDSATPVAVSAGNKIKLLAFDATEGQRVAIRADWTAGNSDVYLYGPFGTILQSRGSSGVVDSTDLPMTATYSVAVDPWFSNAATATLTLKIVPLDYRQEIAFASPLQFPLAIGQNAQLSFTGVAGQRVAVFESGFVCGTSSTSIVAADGAVVATECGGRLLDATTLPSAGPFTVRVDPYGWNAGTTTVTLYNVDPDISDTIGFGESNGKTVTMTVAQNAKLTFNGTTGQRLAINQTGLTCAQSSTSVHKVDPDGTLASPIAQSCGSTFIDTFPAGGLGTSGTYAIVVNPAGLSTGSATLTLYDVPADASGSTTVDGSGVVLQMNAVGQNGQVTFSGSQNQQVRVRVTGNNIPGFTTVKLMRGTTLIAQAASSSGTFDLGLQTLPATDTYTIIVDPDALNTGNATVSVTSS